MIAGSGREGSGDKQRSGGRREWKLEERAGQKRPGLCSVHLFSKLDLSLFLRTHEEAEFENEGKKRKPEGVKSLH